MFEINAILLEPYRAVYVEIPKVACTSIKTALAEILGISLRSTGETLTDLGGRLRRYHRVTQPRSFQAYLPSRLFGTLGIGSCPAIAIRSGVKLTATHISRFDPESRTASHGLMLSFRTCHLPTLSPWLRRYPTTMQTATSDRSTLSSL